MGERTTARRFGEMGRLALRWLAAGAIGCSGDGSADDEARETSVDVSIDSAPILDSAGVADVGDGVAEDDGSGDGSALADTVAGPVGALLDWEVVSAGATSENWFDFPYPSDLRLTAAGHPDVSAIPNPANKPIVRSLVAAAGLADRFPLMPVAWFRFDGPVRSLSPETILPGVAGEQAMLVVVDEDSPRRGERVPLVSRALNRDSYTPDNVLALAAVPGFVLEPATTYAFVVFRGWGDSAGEPLASSGIWAELAAGRTDGLSGLTLEGRARVRALYAPLWSALTEAEPPSEIAAATVFTTGASVETTYSLTEAVRERYAPELTDLAVDPDDGAAHDGYCELHGRLEVPEFQTGEPPYNTGGRFVFDGSGQVQEQRSTSIPVVVNLPWGTMPAEGFPLVLYFHGSGGLSTQVVDRGPDGTTGRGPAWVLATRGMGSASSALPVNPERLPGATDIAYINFNNLAAFPDTFRQGVIEQRLLLDALLRLRVAPEVVAGCPEVALAAGADAFRFDPEPVLAMGQSMGGMYTNMIGPVEPRIRAVVPTGAGGYWSFFILQTDLIPGAATLLGSMLATRELSFMHPTLHLLQTGWNDAEPMVYAPRLARQPLPGHPARPVYSPVGLGDHYFPPGVFDAIALATGNQQAGDVVWETMQPRLALGGQDGFAAYPVVNNRSSEDGRRYTGVVAQYPEDGIHDGHNIFQYDERVQLQYVCFFRTFLDHGSATVVGPGQLIAPCE